MNNRILDQFADQRTRGVLGFGLYDRDNKRLFKTPKEKKILSYLRNRASTDILFHHRFPTSTGVTTSACHPFSTKNYFSELKGFSGTTYILAHNGVIDNDIASKMKRVHEGLGIQYSSVQSDRRFNDSETLLWDLALYLEGRKSELEVYGRIAFILMAVNDKKGDSLFYGRNFGNPLKVDQTDSHLFLSSEGKGVEVEPHTLFKLDYKDNVITKKDLKIPSFAPYISSANPYTYDEQLSLSDEDEEDVAVAQGFENDQYKWDPVTEMLWVKDEDGEWMEYELVANKHIAEKFNDPDELYETDEPDCSQAFASTKGMTKHLDDSGRQADISARLKHYIDCNNGIYNLVKQDVTKDLEWLRNELSGMINNRLSCDDLTYETFVTQTIFDLLKIDPTIVTTLKKGKP